MARNQTIDFRNRAKILYEANFCMFGIGHFDVYENEVAEILFLLNGKNPKENLKLFYKKLYEKRMGETL